MLGKYYPFVCTKARVVVIMTLPPLGLERLQGLPSTQSEKEIRGGYYFIS